MKNRVGTLTTVDPTPADRSDGIAAFAADHLRAVRYPNRIDDIAVVGRLRDWHRSFLLRPRFGGSYVFLMYPRHNPTQELVLESSFRVPSFNSPPTLLDVVVPRHLRSFHEWEWRVVKTGDADGRERELEALDDLRRPADGMVLGAGSTILARHALAERAYSTLALDLRPAMSGEVGFDQERAREEARITVWSCHQPYETVDGVGAVKKRTETILDWFRARTKRFSPHMVWMLGDSVYSDGTSSLDFVRQVHGEGGWHDSAAKRKDLLSLYRLNYRYHWSFDALQEVMRSFPHLGMWDDHEIRDGYGSDEQDFTQDNVAIRTIASQAAEEYLFQYGPKLRSESTRNSAVDNHMAYVDNTMAAFVFDGRNSRDYGEDMPVPSEVPVLASALAGFLLGLAGGPAGAAAGAAAGSVAGLRLSAEIVDVYRWHNPGEVVSDLQLQDFERFCHHLKGQSDVTCLVLGNCVPFIYILDFVESFAAESAIAATDTGMNMRDDIRDSWHSPANRRQLVRLVDVLRDLHQARPDLLMLNVSGDIHLSNAFMFQPDGFSRPLFQITSSPLTNDPPSAEGFLDLVSVDGPLGVDARSDVFGPMRRLWHVATQNFMTIRSTSSTVEVRLHVFDADDPTSGSKDRVITLRPDGGYSLTTAAVPTG